MYKEMKMTIMVMAVALLLAATLFVVTVQHGAVIDGVVSAEIATNEVMRRLPSDEPPGDTSVPVNPDPDDDQPIGGNCGGRDCSFGGGSG